MRLPRNNCCVKPNDSRVKAGSKNVSSLANMLRNAIFASLCNIIFAPLGMFSVILLQKLILNSTNN